MRFNEKLNIHESRNCIHQDCLENDYPKKEIIEPVSRTDWGNWKGANYCYAGQLATGFLFEWQPSIGSGDDSGGNSFLVQCNYRNKNAPRWIGNYGKWRAGKHSAYCPSGSYLNAIQINTESKQGGCGPFSCGDDTALCNVRLWCKNPITGNEVQLSEPKAPNFGSWTDKMSCKDYYGVVGVNVKIEDWQGKGNDDTMLNKIRLFCGPITEFMDATIDDRS